jgi:hypothetical protein
MKSVLASGLMAATASAVVTVGDGVPLIYAHKPYPATVYNGTQYNATTINGVPYNASNEWPCLTAKGYESIIPTCSHYCIDTALHNDGCDVDDFVCHCETPPSNKLDSIVVPCLTTGDTATCSNEEIGELVNFVHGALCPYFEAVTDAYKTCPHATQDSSWTSTTSTAQCSTSTWTTVNHSWTSFFSTPTTFSFGSTTWTVSSATTLTVTGWPVTGTLTSTWAPVPTSGSGTYQNSTSSLGNSAQTSTYSGQAAGTGASSATSPLPNSAASSVRAGVAAGAVACAVAMML